MEPVIARKTWRTVEPIHGLVYFAPQAAEAYAALGLRDGSGYFASRAAPMGPVGAEVVTATFFNFAPGFVRASMDGVWEQVTPAAIIEARGRAAGEALRAAIGDEVASSDAVREAAALARRAAEAAAPLTSGRPLFAGHVSLPWPDEPLLVLWHAQSLLREFRGDNHLAAMLCEGIGGCEALVAHAATGEISRAALQASRAWSDHAWDAAVEDLQRRGHLDADGGFTAAGRASRQWIEDRTDALSLPAYEPLGDAGCERLRTLCRPLSKAIVERGAFTLR